MSFRARLFLAFLAAVLIPIAVLILGVRRELDTRLTEQYRRRVDALANLVRDDLAREGTAVGRRLAALGRKLGDDNRLRLAAVQGDPSARRYLLDYAADAMHGAGLAALQLQDSAGRILSSGHFRNEFDRVDPVLPRALFGPDSLALVRLRTPEEPILVLARADTFRVAGRQFWLVGGSAVGGEWLGRLARGDDLEVRLELPGATEDGVESARVVRAFPIRYLDAASGDRLETGTARFLVTHQLTELQALRRSTDGWLLAALGLTLGLALLLAAWLASRVSRPLAELARKTQEIDLDRLDQDFTTDRGDEIGSLSRLLDAMIRRLRQSSARLREVERRAATGEVARQVNHDIKNGLAPIRNVLRHMAQVARDQPRELAAVFEERRSTLESSVEYLETLARNYARLTPRMERRPCDVNEVVRQAIASVGRRVEVRDQLATDLPPALSDETALRRIVENLLGNAVDSVDGSAGVVQVSTARERDGSGRSVVRIAILDSGRGMTREELDRAFEGFYTTKAGGTGLGLSIVRRLVLDLEGAVRVQTAPGKGTRVEVDLPAAVGSEQ